MLLLCLVNGYTNQLKELIKKYKLNKKKKKISIIKMYSKDLMHLKDTKLQRMMYHLKLINNHGLNNDNILKHILNHI